MKVNASLKDISTTYVQPDPDTYEFEVAEITEGESNEGGVYRQTIELKNKIVSDGDHKGKPITVYINVHKKDGAVNEFSLADLKRMFLAIAPDQAEDDEPDVDILKGGRFLAEVYHETFIRKSGPDAGKEAVAAKINMNTLQPV